MQRLKVYGGLTMIGREQLRTVVAAPNAETVAKLTGASAYYIRGYWSVTGNKNEIAAAMAKPGVLLYEEYRYGGVFKERSELKEQPRQMRRLEEHHA